VNGVHDMGGMHGFGPIMPERDEPYFHEPWEARMFGIDQAMTWPPGSTNDRGRFERENMPPVAYLSLSYYEHWYHVASSLLLKAGRVTRAELGSGQAEAGAIRRNDAMQPDAVATAFKNNGKSGRAISNSPRFVDGQAILTRNINPEGHTRLPRYARGKRGRIHAWRGAHVFPDTSARGDGEQPEHVYCVEITARELWGEGSSARDLVFLDLWESYLDAG
jgi:nitrile hydratase subunit beta